MESWNHHTCLRRESRNIFFRGIIWYERELCCDYTLDYTGVIAPDSDGVRALVRYRGHSSLHPLSNSCL